MSTNAMTHIILTDDDGSGTTGTIINNDLFAQVQDAVDDAIGRIAQSKSGTYTVLVSDDVVEFTASGTCNLYTASGNSGRPLTVVNRATSGDVVIDGYGSEAINGALTYTIGPGVAVCLECNGTGWLIAPVGFPAESDQIVLASQIFG